MHSEIVIVGGGAGGLELASKLGRKLGPRRVVLVDCRLTHVWKPSLHEVAAGTLDMHQEGLSYQMLAHDNGFSFIYGALARLDPAARRLTISAVHVADGEELLPERELGYAKLVIAVGSTANYFGVPGAAENSISLNATEDAERFRLRMLKLLVKADTATESNPGAGIDIVIIGGGATGVELAAELREASGIYASYGLRQLAPLRDIHITLLEGAPRILAPLPERVAGAAHRLLEQNAIHVVTDCRITRIDADQVHDARGNVYPANLCVWAAGIGPSPLLATLGLPTKQGLIAVDACLQVPGVADVYAIGDCAACTDGKGQVVPPRAQAAHQQAAYLLKRFLREARGKAPQSAPYVYRDHGSLVSFGRTSGVGTLMGSLKGASWFVEGLFARTMYASLHLLHHAAVLGGGRTAVMALARFLIRRSKPLVKLH